MPEYRKVNTINIPDLSELRWQEIGESLHEKGFAHVPNLVDKPICKYLINLYEEDIYRKKIIMERHRFGRGEYKYFSYPLPLLVEQLRCDFYPFLSGIANEWMNMLNDQTRYPATQAEFINLCATNRQRKPTPLILKYQQGGFNTLHQDLYGAVYFPIQLMVFLSNYGEDYTGGEFVLTEQVPRTQSKARVFQPGLGDAMLFATSFRPVKGKRSYYRANLRHGVSEVLSGQRHTLGIIFHDAA